MPWWKSIFLKRASDAQMNSELRFHIDELTDENIAAGISPSEARRRAILEFGGHEQVKEDLRDVYRVRIIESTYANLNPPSASSVNPPRFPSPSFSPSPSPLAQTARSSPPSTRSSSSRSRSPTRISSCSLSSTTQKAQRL
jgi:hypothetical protein